MAFIDEIQFNAKAGKGGDGVVRWRQEKFIDRGGPWGGNGGKGGDVYAVGTRDIHILAKYRHQKEFPAENGQPGDKKLFQGKGGDDLKIELPVGSIITNTTTGEQYSLIEEGQEILLLKGGRGGLGNAHFKSSTNVAPKEWTPGDPGEEAEFKIELQLFADVGLIGFPNAGKSSLLNMITNAGAKVGDYAFTTLDPNLGAFHGYIIADIPGIIEGAAEGKGLGVKFLRHIKRTKMLAHLISFENVGLGGGMMKAYKTIREELAKSSPELTEKEEVIVLTKTDLSDEKTIAKHKKEFEKLGKPVFTLSLFDDSMTKEFADGLVKLLRQK